MSLFPNNSCKRFLVKLLLFFTPFVPLVVIYFVNDPFMKLHTYKRFDQSRMFLDEAYVGWRNILMNKDSLGFNSFIMGNSCTMAYNTREWEKHLDKGSVAVRFFDNAESLGGVYQKLESLDSIGIPIKNVLVVFDRKSLLSPYPLDKTKNLYSPEAAGISEMEFQLKSLQAFLYPSVLLPYLEYSITGKYKSSMKKVILEVPTIREPYTNNFINPREKEIQRKGELYWLENKSDFEPRQKSPKEETPIVKPKQIKVLRQIKQLCDKHHADFILIIGPDFLQKRLNKKDLSLIKKEIGNNNVWDFTGINEYTNDIHNYFEPGHYRPLLGKRLMDTIYAQRMRYQNLKEIQPKGRQ